MVKHIDIILYLHIRTRVCLVPGKVSIHPCIVICQGIRLGSKELRGLILYLIDV